MGIRKLVSLGASLAALTAASQAGAQATSAVTLDAPAKAPEAEASSSGDIVVTARRRNELLQDVPIAVSAISAATIERSGISNSEAITIATPSLDFSRQVGQGATPFLRGVGSTQAAAGGESPLAIYVDDVYIGSPNASLFAMNNIAAIQVLKGPQGTLFGRNATAGVIQLTTKQPSFDPATEFSLGYGNYNTLEGSFYGTTGLTDDVALNFAASGRKQSDGFGRSVTTGAETQLGWDWNLRAQLLWNLGENTKVRLSGDYSDQQSDLGTNSSVAPGTVSISGGTFVGAFNTQIPELDYARIKQGGVSLKIEHEASFADLISISAYRETRFRASYDQDAGAPRFVQFYGSSPNKTYTQELQLVSKPGSALKWILGGYYLYTRTGYDRFEAGGLAFGPTMPFFNTVTDQRLHSASVFGEATYEILRETNLTLGLRYTRDSYKLAVKGVFTGGVALPNSAFDRQDAFPKLTYRAIVDHKFSPDIMAYVSYSRGFKSGGYNLQAPGNPIAPAPAIQPEVLDAYEVGLKTKSFDGKLTFNASAYYYDYSNLAVNLVLPTGSVVINAAAARIKGADIDFVATPFQGFTLTGGVGLIDGEYTRFPNGPFLVDNPATCTPVPARLPGPRTPGSTQCTVDLAGKTTVRSPKFTLSLTPSYSIATRAGTFILSGTYYHNSGFFWAPSNQRRQDSYDLVNTSVSWQMPNRHLEVRLWARNLLDTRYLVFNGSSTSGEALAYAPPRTYGVTLTARY